MVTFIMMYYCRSNSSILGQRKKNQRKNEAKKRASQRKNNECESGDEDKVNRNKI